MFQLVVKANSPREARHHATRRGLQPIGSVIRNSGTHYLMRVRGQLANLVAWYCEPRAGQDYPAGTLLFYSDSQRA